MSLSTDTYAWPDEMPTIVYAPPWATQITDEIHPPPYYLNEHRTFNLAQLERAAAVKTTANRERLIVGDDAFVKKHNLQSLYTFQSDRQPLMPPEPGMAGIMMGLISPDEQFPPVETVIARLGANPNVYTYMGVYKFEEIWNGGLSVLQYLQLPAQTQAHYEQSLIYRAGEGDYPASVFKRKVGIPGGFSATYPRLRLWKMIPLICQPPEWLNVE
ncbi:hypothetical protein FA95DRAFT_1614049 [Auriscalpium vulgare]|uniref:Uncharacterized protein n=1 Tax=Auriscalpium vulgare TaxID=40419 RepID=A0ACB8R242_9AGAM|nr:hypothetical protein FA95DRAFT_1614049 [Auriscalpium vulgare]